MILVLPLLALVTQQAQINSEIVVSYVVALHLWFVVCIFFIFMGMIELAIALIYCQKVADWKDKEAHEKLVEQTTAAVRRSMKNVPPQDIELGDIKLKDQRRHSYGSGKRGSIFSLSSDKASHNSTAHLIKVLLNHIYGPIDWRKAPADRNKIDYVSRILFPSTFLLFVIFYFTSLNR